MELFKAFLGGILLGFTFSQSLPLLPPPESSLGRPDQRPLDQPIAVGTTVRPGHILTTGTLRANLDTAQVEIGPAFVITVHPDGIPWTILKQYSNKPVRIVIQEDPPRTLEKLNR